MTRFAFLLVAAGLVLRARDSSGPVASKPHELAAHPSRIAGRVYSAGETLLLELENGRARILRVDRSGTLKSELLLAETSVALDPFGLARTTDGILWVLADRGRVLIGFDPSVGAVADIRPLSTTAQLVWELGGVVMVAGLPLTGGQPFISRMNPTGFTACSPLRTRPVADFLDAPILGMMSCGASRDSEMPCWWTADDSTVFLLSPACAVRAIKAPSLAVIRRPPPAGGDRLERFSYPIRDVFRVSMRELWILTNQEGDLTPFAENSRPARHAFLVVDGQIRKTVSLPRKARLVLDGASTWVSILYSDGTLERITAP